jgi:biotin carboxylase
VKDFESAKAFANMVGYPVVVKPDNGVGASSTYRLKCDSDLEYFFATKNSAVQFVMEEMVRGYVTTYDAIIGSKGQPLFESGNVTPSSLMDVVNDKGESLYYIHKEVPADVRDAGLRTVAAFGVKSRFVHLEFFRLTQDQEGLGKAGDIIGLETNMRPSGGFTPDMYNFAYETDVYKIWADMIAFVESTKPLGDRHFCAFCGRRDGVSYKLDHAAVLEKYGAGMMMEGRIPDALSGAMGNEMFMCNFQTEEEMWQYYHDLMERV